VTRRVQDPADEYGFSQSDYSSYGNAPKGDICGAPSPGHPYGTPILDAHGNPVIARHRPLDTTTVNTSRYSFRYDGRWLMTGISISPDNGGLSKRDFGPNVVDRWKARAFAQDPSSKTPCLRLRGGGHALGRLEHADGRAGRAVRAIRATWGADSGTNVVRMETFYADQMRSKSWLRVHVIPPLDGIYAQWDFRAGRMTRYYNPNEPNGVAVDGRNDHSVREPRRPVQRQLQRINEGTGIQGNRDSARRHRPQPGLPPGLSGRGHLQLPVALPPVDQPRRSDVRGAERLASVERDGGPLGHGGRPLPGRPGHGPSRRAGWRSRCWRCPTTATTRGFDDGTGSDPGPRVDPGSSNEPRTYVDPATGLTKPRACWKPSDGTPAPGDQRYFQGDIATHGLHMLFQLESDNARQQVPIDEIVSDQRMVLLPASRGTSASSTAASSRSRWSSGSGAAGSPRARPGVAGGGGRGGAPAGARAARGGGGPPARVSDARVRRGRPRARRTPLARRAPTTTDERCNRPGRAHARNIDPLRAA